MTIRTVLLATALSAVAPASALAATPAVTTGGTSNVSPNAATVKGSLNPNGRVTTWYFQYGRTKNYGHRTTAQDAGSGTKRVLVSSTLTGLAGKTTYHYRLVATNSSGTTAGADRTFKTPEAPTVSTIAAGPNPVTFGKPVLVGGFLVGPRGGGNKQVALQANPFPYTAGFQQVGNTVVTNPDGSYQFAIGVPVTEQLRVVDKSDTAVVSPVITESVASKVSVYVRHVKRGVRRFHGTVRPAGSAAAVLVQRQTHLGGWKTVNVALTHPKSGAPYDTWSHKVRVKHGSYRLVTRAIGGYVEGISRTVKIPHR